MDMQAQTFRAMIEEIAREYPHSLYASGVKPPMKEVEAKVVKEKDKQEKLEQ